MDTDSFKLSVNTKDIMKDLKNLEDIFDFSNLDKNHELFSKKKQKKLVNLKLKPLKRFGLMNSLPEKKCLLRNVEMIVKIK